jgi:hypothetical protein
MFAHVGTLTASIQMLYYAYKLNISTGRISTECTLTHLTCHRAAKTTHMPCNALAHMKIAVVHAVITAKQYEHFKVRTYPWAPMLP